MSLLALLFAAACNNTTYVAKTVTPSSMKAEQRMTFYWWGLSGVGEVNVAQTCGDRGAARINTQNTFTDSLLGLVTLGIYTPRTAFITCGAGTGDST
ncbi:MAG: Bor family protein [Myxococcales bacterium]